MLVRVPVVAALITITLALSSGVAAASHVEPELAKKAIFTLVNRYRCDTLNTQTASGLQACAPPIQDDRNCVFTADGSGKLTLAVTGTVANANEKLAITVTAKGLDCEDRLLRPYVVMRVTTDDCPQGSCTTDDVFLRADDACRVTNGVCKVQTEIAGVLTMGRNSGIEILGCGLEEPLNLDPVLACGLLFK